MVTDTPRYTQLQDHTQQDGTWTHVNIALILAKLKEKHHFTLT